ncbi:MAG: hypothetical protein ABJC04_02300 [Verrucomicrobiota bacterium]
MKTQLWLRLAAVSLLAALPVTAQVTLPNSLEAFVQGGTAASADQDETSTNYLIVKFGASPFSTARKSYFKFDFTGQTPNTNALLKLKFSTVANNRRQHMQVWTLNQDYPDFTSPVLTWNGAQANDTAGNGLLASGGLTATVRADFISPNAANLNAVVSIPPPWGDAIINGKIFLVLATVNDTTNDNNGTRITLNSTALEFTSLISGSPPTLSSIPNITTVATQNSATNSFTVGDVEDGPNALTPVATSSNEAVVPSANVFFTGTGADRSVYVVGAAAGTATLTVTVTDSNGNIADRLFTVTVLPFNFAPVLSTPAPTNTPLNTPVTVAFTVSDVETPANNLVVTGEVATYSTTILSSVTFGSDASGTNRTVIVTPVNGANGVGVVKIIVSDPEGNSNTVSFAVMVLAAPNVVFNDHFDYPAAATGLFPGSASLWAQRSVTAGAIRFSTQNGAAFIRPKTNADDGAARLAGGPYTPASRAILYAKFTATWIDGGLEVATNSVGGFFNLSQTSSSTSIQVADVATLTNSAPPGNFNLGLSDLASVVQPNTNVAIPTLGGPYTIVTRYDVAAAKSTLWVNATTEADPSVSVSDRATPVAINYVGLRQDLGMGYIYLDDLQVTVAITPSITSATPPAGGNVDIFFSAGATDAISNFGVDGASTVAGPYGNVIATITSLGGGNFKATVSTVSATQGYYRVKRQPVTF